MPWYRFGSRWVRQRERAEEMRAHLDLYAVVLLVGAALFIASFARLMRIDVGLDYRDVLVMDVRPKAGTSARLTTVLEHVRTREIGIRMALGARVSTILWSVLRRASTQVAVGLFVGLGLAWLFATSVERFLFMVEPHDLRLFAAVGGLLVSTALAAALFPARRAARVDPLVALRLE